MGCAQDGSGHVFFLTAMQMYAMLKSSIASDSMYIAGNFYTDAEDLLNRYSAYFERHFGIKSRRFKSFVDLRMALESLLKSVCALYGDHARDRKDVVRDVESYGHSIPKLLRAAEVSISPSLVKELRPFVKQIDDLPIGLRYALDGYDFLSAKHELYYATIGDDSWMYSLHALLSRLSKEVSDELAKHSGIVRLSDIPIEKLLEKSFNKYDDG
jgi:hypothetical protein